MAVEDTSAVECHLYLNTRYRGKMPYTKPKRSRLMARIMYKMKTVNVQKPTLPIATVFPHHYTSKHMDFPIRRTPVKRESNEEGGCMAKGLKAEPIEFPADLEESFHAGQLQQHCSLAAKHCQDDDMLSQKARWRYYNKPTMTRCRSYKGTTQWSQRPRQTIPDNSSIFTASCKEDAGNRCPPESSEVADGPFYLSANNNTSPQNPVSAGLGLEQSDDRIENNRNWKNVKDDTSISSPKSTGVDITCKRGIGGNYPDNMVHPVLLEDIHRVNPYDTCCMQNTNLVERESAGQEDLASREYKAFPGVPSQEQLLSVEHDVKNNNVEEIIHSSLPGEEDNPPSPVFNSKAVLSALNTQGSGDKKHKISCKANDAEVEHCGFEVFPCAEGLVPKGAGSKAGIETIVSSRIPPLSITGTETTDQFEAAKNNLSTHTFWKEVVNDDYSSDSEPPFPLTQKYQERDTDDCAVPDGDNLDPLIFPESPLLYSQYFEG